MSDVGEFASIATTIWYFLQSTNSKKSSLSDKKSWVGGSELLNHVELPRQVVKKGWNCVDSGFQLEFVSISRFINHMTCYNSSALIGRKIIA